MRIREIVSTALIVLFVAMAAVGCANTGGGSGGQYQDSHSGHSH